MARQDALLRLYKALLARATELRRTLADELTSLGDVQAADSAGDSADLAFKAASDEMSSHLAELDADELSQVEEALARLRQGTLGLCEGGSQSCQRKIPVARLNALPYSRLCINCQRQMDKYPDWPGHGGKARWGKVFDPDAPTEDQRINLTELEMNLSGNRRG
ncbi:MAG TPA: TraR/DksA family transcriptional regulator [Gemmataceae bacterium]|jgi:DnaK suppressor protein|nr:TraR/DksA family transcriptional regulator [Gemmataceae bacterium]